MITAEQESRLIDWIKTKPDLTEWTGDSRMGLLPFVSCDKCARRIVSDAFDDATAKYGGELLALDLLWITDDDTERDHPTDDTRPWSLCRGCYDPIFDRAIEDDDRQANID